MGVQKNGDATRGGIEKMRRSGGNWCGGVCAVMLGRASGADQLGGFCVESVSGFCVLRFYVKFGRGELTIPLISPLFSE